MAECLVTLKIRVNKIEREREKLIRTVWKVLFVGKDEDDGVTHFAVVDYSVKFCACLFYSISIGTVDNED